MRYMLTDSDLDERRTVSTNRQLVQDKKGFLSSRREFVKITGVVATLAGFSALVSKVPFQIETTKAQAQTTAASTEQVIPSACRNCNSNDGILVHVVDGNPTYIEGDPKDPLITWTLLCKRSSRNLVSLRSVQSKGSSEEDESQEGYQRDWKLGPDILGRGLQDDSGQALDGKGQGGRGVRLLQLLLGGLIQPNLEGFHSCCTR